MAPQVEYINPYGDTLRPTNPVKELWFPTLCLLVFMAAAVGMWWLTYRQGVRNAPPVASVPAKPLQATPGPSVSTMEGEEPIDVETHNLCDYLGHAVEAEDNITAFVERYRCATTTVKLRMRTKPREPGS